MTRDTGAREENLKPPMGRRTGGILRRFKLVLAPSSEFLLLLGDDQEIHGMLAAFAHSFAAEDRGLIGSKLHS